ncbi:hypothetical protein BT69DRAFT_1321771 [Atractiella rhizophila]|nr:hypothetical protein BT69DRAFT_1321771 [Atractiella rhizophila]
MFLTELVQIGSTDSANFPCLLYLSEASTMLHHILSLILFQSVFSIEAQGKIIKIYDPLKDGARVHPPILSLSSQAKTEYPNCSGIDQSQDQTFFISGSGSTATYNFHKGSFDDQASPTCRLHSPRSGMQRAGQSSRSSTFLSNGSSMTPERTDISVSNKWYDITLRIITGRTTQTGITEVWLDGKKNTLSNGLTVARVPTWDGAVTEWRVWRLDHSDYSESEGGQSSNRPADGCDDE